MAAARQAGIVDVVISPGSRNAPLIIEAEAYPGLQKHIIVDERTAAFTALGMSQASNKPVMLICTSGTAVLNYHPAVAEAFYSRIPLIVVSADRPPYRIDKGEGQTIRQKDVLKNHTLVSVNLPLENEEKKTKTLIAYAFEKAIRHKGPVHINVPFEEPLYEFSKNQEPLPFIRIGNEFSPTPVADEILNHAEKIWKKSKKKLIIVSQIQASPVLTKQLERLAKFPDTVVLTENLSNVQGNKILAHIDRLVFPLTAEEWQSYAPDLVVTIGNNIISKKIKYLLRETKIPNGHWHIGNAPVIPDTFDILTEHFQTDPEIFLSQLLFRIYDTEPVSDFSAIWWKLAADRKMKHGKYLKNIPAGDFCFYELLSKKIRPPYYIQWGNSTVIRYAQLVEFAHGIKHFSNRGTSGIDGSLSTAVGFARKTSGPVLAVLGDLSFRYDANALWQELPPNLKIIVIRNNGGDIFRFIPGPSLVQNFEKYFVASGVPMPDIRLTAESYGIDYMYTRPDHKKELQAAIDEFLNYDKNLIWELDTARYNNAKILKEYFRFLHA
jgi:2-succinyl-5-enolpyruvyl-6-hydroxy-3-cyclohexene-1-carboxylate synthase